MLNGIMSSKIQFILIGFYIILSVTSVIEKNYAKGLYWIGAIILASGVLLMK